uniref:Secreted protein n=1 Tax=Schistosoma curassoni TaxID=6186 RepID=A0A183KUS9_9TREM
MLVSSMSDGLESAFCIICFCSLLTEAKFLCSSASAKSHILVPEC